MVQLHGFSQQKRETDSARHSDLIISAATEVPPQWLFRTRHLFRESFPRNTVNVFPINVEELGGTTNRQAEILFSHGGSRFLHVEMSQDFRRTMTLDKSLQDQFIRTLVLMAD